MRLILEIAVTHIVGRGGQTIVAILGVAVGVGFSIAMTALMQGSQNDFIEQLVNVMPHVEITDDRRSPPRQPAEDVFTDIAIIVLRRGGPARHHQSDRGSDLAEGLGAGTDLAASLKVQGVTRFAGR